MTQDEIIELAGHRKVSPWIIKLVNDAVAKEREACAKLCEAGVDREHPTVKGHIMNNFGESSFLAEAIRSRGQQS